jgi:hypothetical protein
MMELAEAAERAAEAGEESFAVRPSTFGTSEWSNAMDDSLVKTPTTAAVTRTSRLTPMLIRKRVEKIGVTELRDVHEVFPDFGEFHTHLRTHLVRRGVDRKATVFKEKSKDDTSLNFFRDLNDWMSPSTAAIEQKHSQNSCISAWDIGNILAEPMDLSGPKTQAAESLRHQVKEGRSARQPIATEAHPRPSMYRNRIVHSSTPKTVRRALFDDDDDDFPLSLPGIQSPQHTKTSHRRQAPDMTSTTQDTRKPVGDFVTPVRLRDIRRLSDTDDQSDGFMSSSSLLDSPVYMLRENEERREKIDMALHDMRTSLSSIMLPSLASTHSLDTTRVEKRNALMLEGIHTCEIVEDRRDEASEETPISGFPIIGPLLLDGVAPFTSRENSRLEEMEPHLNDEGLLNDQLVRLHYEPSNQHYTSSIHTPMHDECGCLSIPTNSSLDSNEPSSSTPQDSQLVKHVVAVNEARSLSKRVNPLASLISRMSPRSNVFHSMKNSRLYFRSKDNDDFLNNYLYCSKPVERCHKEKLSLFSKSCQDTPNSCMEFNVNSCCTAILPHTFSDIHSMKPTNNTVPQHSFVSLGGSLKSEAELWFDRATENFDHLLERLSGAPSTNSAWSVSFQAPTLNKKIVPMPHADLPPASPVSAMSDTGGVLDLDSVSLKEMDLSTNSKSLP